MGYDRLHTVCVFLDNLVSVQAHARAGPVVILLEGHLLITTGEKLFTVLADITKHNSCTHAPGL